MENYVKIPLDDPLGSLMLGTFFNSMLYSQELILMLKYFRHSRGDHPFLRATMALLLANDSFSTAAEIYCVYEYCISNWGNLAFLEVQTWPITAFCITTGVSAFICQTFLVHRVHRLTKNWLYTVPLMVATCAAFAGTVWAGYEQVVNKKYADRDKGNAAVSMWLIASAVDDAAISGLLLTFLWKARKVARQFEGSALVGPLTRMMILTVETGGLTAAWAAISLAVYLHHPSSNAAVGMGYCLGRLYALTVLFCLAQRGSVQRDGQFPSSPGHSAYATKARTVGGVSVTHQATVVIDERDEHELATFAARSGAGQRKQAAAAAPPPPKMFIIGASEAGSLDEKRSYGVENSV